MPSNFDEWSRGIDVTVKRMVGEDILRLQRAVTFLALGAAVEVSPGNIRVIMGVVLRTPVNTGRARASWNVAIGTPSTLVPDPGQQHYDAPSIDGARASLRGLGPYNVVWITSGLPYMRVLEYGLYPSPPKFGTWVPGRGGSGHFEIRSADGYSKQAPQGIVRLTADEIMEILSGI